MTHNELSLLQKEMSICTNYLEFGSGNSTILAIQTTEIKKITVVESDFLFWKKLVSSNPVLTESINLKRLTPLLVNIGPTKEFGYPADNRSQSK